MLLFEFIQFYFQIDIAYLADSRNNRNDDVDCDQYFAPCAFVPMFLWFWNDRNKSSSYKMKLNIHTFYNK